MLYDKIRGICEKKKISISDMEKELGFAHATVRKWNKSEPGVHKLSKVAKYLGVSIEELLN